MKINKLILFIYYNMTNTKRLFKRKARKTRSFIQRKKKLQTGGELTETDLTTLNELLLKCDFKKQITEQCNEAEQSKDLLNVADLAINHFNNAENRKIILPYFQAIFDEKILNGDDKTYVYDQIKIKFKNNNKVPYEESRANEFLRFLSVDKTFPEKLIVQKILNLASKCYLTYKKFYTFPDWVISLNECKKFKLANTRVFYCSDNKNGTNSNDIFNLILKREPCNFGDRKTEKIERKYDEELFNHLFDYKHGAYGSYTQHKLMPNIAIYTNAMVKMAQQTLSSVHVINLVGYSFNCKEQPDYKYFLEKYGESDDNFYEETVDLNDATQGHNDVTPLHKNGLKELVGMYTEIWMKAFAALMHLKDEGVNIENIHIFNVGGDKASTRLAPITFTDENNNKFIEEVFVPSFTPIYEKLKRKKITIKGLVDEKDLSQGFVREEDFKIPNSLFEDEKNGLLQTTLYVNACNPWSLIGNGNSSENSLNGHWGRCSNMSVLGWGMTNVFLMNNSDYYVDASNHFKEKIDNDEYKDAFDDDVNATDEFFDPYEEDPSEKVPSITKREEDAEKKKIKIELNDFKTENPSLFQKLWGFTFSNVQNLFNKGANVVTNVTRKLKNTGSAAISSAKTNTISSKLISSERSPAYTAVTSVDSDLTATPVAYTATTPKPHTATHVAHAKTPVAHTATPVAHTATPVAHTATPVAHATTHVAHAKTPLAHTATPVAHATTHVAHTATPVAHTATPVAPAKTPFYLPHGIFPIHSSTAASAPLINKIATQVTIPIKSNNVTLKNSFNDVVSNSTTRKNGKSQRKNHRMWSQDKLLLFDLNKRKFLLLRRRTRVGNIYDELITDEEFIMDEEFIIDKNQTYPYIFEKSQNYDDLFLLNDVRRKTKYLITLNDEKHYNNMKKYLALAHNPTLI